MHGPSDGVPRRDVPEVPREVGGHIVEEEIGSSADGVVYRARRNRLPVALKVLHRGSGADRTLIERLSRGSPRRIRHPNLPIIEAFGEADERLWYSTKYLRGDTLRRAIDDIIGGAVGRPSFGPLAPSFDGSLPPDLLSRATRLIADLAEGLGRAHAEGLVHRRIDPDHLIFSPAGRLVALNFDGRPISPPSDLATHRSDEVSRWIYRAPELLRGGDASPQADVWSLGAILYELITLRPIYRVETIRDLMATHRDDSIVPPREIRAEIPHALEHCVLSALRIDPAERPADGARFAEDLRAFLRGEAPRGLAETTRARVASRESRPQGDLEVELHRLRGEIARLVANEERLRARETRVADEERRLREEIDRIEREARALRDQEAQLEARSEALEAERSRLDWEAERIGLERGILRGAIEEQERDGATLAELEDEIRRERDRLAREECAAQETVRKLEIERDEIIADRARLEERSRSLEDDLLALRSEHDLLRVRANELEAAFERARIGEEKTSEAVRERDAEIVALRGRIEDLERELISLRGREAGARQETIETRAQRDRESAAFSERLRRERRRMRVAAAISFLCLIPIAWWIGSRSTEMRNRLAAAERALESLDERQWDEARSAANAFVALDPGGSVGGALWRAVEREAALEETRAGLTRALLAFTDEQPSGATGDRGSYATALRELERLAEKRPNDSEIRRLEVEVRKWAERDPIAEKIADPRPSARIEALHALAEDLREGRRDERAVDLARAALRDESSSVRAVAREIYRDRASASELLAEIRKTSADEPLEAADFAHLYSLLADANDPPSKQILSAWSFETFDALDRASGVTTLPGEIAVSPRDPDEEVSFASLWIRHAPRRDPDLLFDALPRVESRSDLAVAVFRAVAEAAKRDPSRGGEAALWTERVFTRSWWHAARDGIATLVELDAREALERIVHSTMPEAIRSLALDGVAERYGADALSLLEGVALRSPAAPLRDQAIRHVATIAPSIAEPARWKLLCEAFHEPRHRADAESWYAKLGEADRTRIAFALLSHGEPELRRRAVETLANAEGELTTRTLILKLFSPSRRLRSTALAALEVRLPIEALRERAIALLSSPIDAIGAAARQIAGMSRVVPISETRARLAERGEAVLVELWQLGTEAGRSQVPLLVRGLRDAFAHGVRSWWSEVSRIGW